MTLSNLVLAMRIDLGDADGELFADTALERCVIRAISPVGQDAGHPMQMVNGEIIPAPDGMLTEALLLLAESYACGVMRGKTANGVSISSGDKRVDRSTQAKHWAELEADLLAQYRQRITEMTGGDVFLTPPRFTPVRYEQGSEVIE